MEAWKEKRFREFRKCLLPFSEFSEEIVSSVSKKNLISRKRAREKHKENDQKAKRSCLLTSERYKKMLENNSNELLIPDGPIFTSTLQDPSSNLLNDKQNQKENLETKSEKEHSKEDTLNKPQSCYVCKRLYHQLHFFYHKLCQECGEFNFSKRDLKVDLSGKIALVTGGRIKIGYYTALKLLRCGAKVIITTRFPNDSILRFSKEPDYLTWKERLSIFALDFRNIPLVENFAIYLSRTLPQLDILINNACQTIRRPPAYYHHLLENESKPIENLLPNSTHHLSDFMNFTSNYPSKIISTTPKSQLLLTESNTIESVSSSLLTTTGSQQHQPFSSVQTTLTPLLPSDHLIDLSLFPKGKLDTQNQQVDLRPQTSWNLQLHQVETIELLEVMLINSTAPFVLLSKLYPLLSSTPKTIPKYVVNVSSMEGKFARPSKTCFHPHNNMGKAALNMITRTCAEEYQKQGIYITSVDTGWINEENAFGIAKKKFNERGFQTPLDEIDAVARILDPVFLGETEKKYLYGVFLKNFVPTSW